MLAPEQRALWTLDVFTRDQAGMVGLETCQWAIVPQAAGLAHVKLWTQIGTGFPATTARLAGATLVMLDFPTAGPKDNSEWQMWLVAQDGSGTAYLWSLR